MAERSPIWLRRIVWPLIGAAAAIAAVLYFAGIGYRTFRQAASQRLLPEKEPVPPPISEKVPEAPGPDNTVQTLTPPPAVPAQPPSPISSQPVKPPPK